MHDPLVSMCFCVYCSILRGGSEAIKALRNMVGSSGKIYSHLVDLCKVGVVSAEDLPCRHQYVLEHAGIHANA